MKMEFILNKLLGPVILIVLGLILIVSPDSASALIANIVGWVLIAVAIGCGIAAVVSSRGRVGKVICAIVFAIGGGWLHSHPLMLASTIGRFCGLFLWINSIQTIRTNRKIGRRAILPWITAVVGFSLFFIIPLSISRFVFSLCGVVILVAGVAMLLDNLKPGKRLQDPENPDIIDAL